MLKNTTFWRYDTGPAVNIELEFQFIGMRGLGHKLGGVPGVHGGRQWRQLRNWP